MPLLFPDKWLPDLQKKMLKQDHQISSCITLISINFCYYFFHYQKWKNSSLQLFLNLNRRWIAYMIFKLYLQNHRALSWSFHFFTNSHASSANFWFPSSGRFFSWKQSLPLIFSKIFYFSGVAAGGEFTTKVDITVLLLELFFTLYGSRTLNALLVDALSFFSSFRRKASYTFLFSTKSANMKVPWRQLIISNATKNLYSNNSGAKKFM